jgi:hypothetical protein
MKKIIVELKANPKSKSTIIEISDNKTLFELIPVLIKVLGFPITNSHDHQYHYWLEDASGNPLALSAYPSEAGVANQSVLIINRGNELPDVVEQKVSQSIVSTSPDAEKDMPTEAIARNISPQDLRGGLDVPPFWKEISVSKK